MATFALQEDVHVCGVPRGRWDCSLAPKALHGFCVFMCTWMFWNIVCKGCRLFLLIALEESSFLKCTTMSCNRRWKGMMNHQTSITHPSVSSHCCNTALITVKIAIVVAQAGFHRGNWKFISANRIQVIVSRMFIFYLVLLLLHSGKQCLAFPHIVC